MLGRAYRYTRRNFQKWRMTRELARASGYSFTSDYISKNLELDPPAGRISRPSRHPDARDRQL